MQLSTTQLCIMARSWYISCQYQQPDFEQGAEEHLLAADVGAELVLARLVFVAAAVPFQGLLPGTGEVACTD
jgi:hypothetical protein